MVSPDGSETDGDLYKLAVSGSREATEMLVNRHNAALVAYTSAKTSVPGFADDAVADAWLKFFAHLKDAGKNPDKALRKPESLRFWLFKTAFNAVRTQYRHSGRQQNLSARVTSEAETAGALSYRLDELAGMEAAERARTLRVAFQRLSEPCRELLTLLTADPPLSYEEVAEIIGRPVGSIGPTRQRCLAQLRYQFGVVS